MDMANHTKHGAGRRRDPGATRGSRDATARKRGTLFAVEPRRSHASPRSGLRGAAITALESLWGDLSKPPPDAAPPAPLQPEPDAATRAPVLPEAALLLILVDGILLFWLFSSRPEANAYSKLIRHAQLVPPLLSGFGAASLLLVCLRQKWAGWLLLLVCALALPLVWPYSLLALLVTLWALSERATLDFFGAKRRRRGGKPNQPQGKRRPPDPSA